ncbi:MAG: hypothetical protein P1P63_05495, partial [Treponemataceae bacterium]
APFLPRLTTFSPVVNTAENIAILRRIWFNRMQMYQNGKTLKRKKMLCTFDDSFRFNVLFS